MQLLSHYRQVKHDSYKILNKYDKVTEIYYDLTQFPKLTRGITVTNVGSVISLFIVPIHTT